MYLFECVDLFQLSAAV